MIGVRRSAGGYLLATCVAASSVALAEPGDDSSQAPEVSARTETHFRLYQRALLPGPYGAVVTEETAAPIVEYVSVTARDLDAPWQKRGLDVELDAWGSATRLVATWEGLQLMAPLSGEPLSIAENLATVFEELVGHPITPAFLEPRDAVPDASRDADE